MKSDFREITLTIPPRPKVAFDIIWPYACHRHGHIYKGGETRCHACGLPWAEDNRVTAATFAYEAGQMSALMYRSVLRMEGIDWQGSES